MLQLSPPLSLLLAQILTIVLISRVFGYLFKKIGQPTVMGEIIAGIVLGPSLAGIWFPEFSAALFPYESLGNLEMLSQFGLILFMFMVGMELDMKSLKHQARDAFLISQSSIFVPFVMGMVLAYFLYDRFASPDVQFASFAMFVGIALSITAFPVLARIVHERGIHKTRLGSIVLTSAAANDVTAWCILAAVIAVAGAGTLVSSLYVLLMSVIFVLFMMYGLRPFLKRVGDLHPSRENMSKPIVAIFFLTLVFSAYITQIIGVHALFGAFMAGAVMPDNLKVRSILVEKIEDVALVLLMPLFFVYTGLRTEIGLLNEGSLWIITGLIIVVAVVGKFLGSAVPAFLLGQNKRDSLAVGALMNTRGLMELIVLNIGYEMGVLTPVVFSMMVIMALVTTWMTTPLLNGIERWFKFPAGSVKGSRVSGECKVLVSYANPEKGRTLLKLAHVLVRNESNVPEVTVLHLSPNNELSQVNIDEYEERSFSPLIEEAKSLHQKITTLFKVSADIRADITEVANSGSFDLLLMGSEQSIYEGSLLGRILGFTSRIVDPEKLLHSMKGKVFLKDPFGEETRRLLDKVKVPVGIFLEKDFQRLQQVLILLYSEKDLSVLAHVMPWIAGSSVQVALYDPGRIHTHPEYGEVLANLFSMAENSQILAAWEPGEAFFRSFDLMMVSIEGWQLLMSGQNPWLVHIPATLILKV